MLNHEASERGNNGHGLDVEISKHLIRFPMAQECEHTCIYHMYVVEIFKRT
jgi:hypothetical protein